MKRYWVEDGDVMVIHPQTKGMTLACCDCGLVHDVEILRHFPWFLFGAFQLRFIRNKYQTEHLRSVGKDKEEIREEVEE